MTYSITESNSDRTRNFGGQGGAILELDITSYSAGGEDVSQSALGLKRSPNMVVPINDANRFGFKFDKANALLEVTEGQGPRMEFWPDVNDGESSKTATDNASAPTGDANILGDQAVPTSSGGSSEVSSGITDPDFPRSVVVVYENDSGSGNTLNAAEVTVEGTDQYGQSITEVVDLDESGADITGSVSNSNFSWKQTDQTFATVTKVTWANDSGTSQDSSKFSLASGDRFGLASPISSDSDVNRVMTDSSNAGSASGNSANNAVDIGEDLSSSPDVYVQYDASGEVPPSTTVGLTQLLVLY